MTRVSFLKHISSPIPIPLKAFHPTSHKTMSKWLTKHANFLWPCPISQNSPQSTLLSICIKLLGFFNQDVLDIPTQYLLFPLPREFLFKLQDPLQISPHWWSIPQFSISFRIVVPFSVLQKYSEYRSNMDVYQVFNDYNLMACLHIFLPTPLGEPQGQECIFACLDHV